VGDADAAKSAARDEQAGTPLDQAVDRGDSIEVADLVLSARAGPSVDACEERRTLDAEQRRDRSERQRDQLGVRAIERARITHAGVARTTVRASMLILELVSMRNV